MSNDWNDRCFNAIDDSNYFCDVLYGMFYEDDDFLTMNTIYYGHLPIRYVMQ